MEKKLKRYGGSSIVTFTREEKEINKMDDGDILDIEIKNVRRDLSSKQEDDLLEAGREKDFEEKRKD